MYAFNGYLQEARHVPIPKGEDYAIDVDSTVETCQRERVKLLIFSNPGNPTSIVCTREEVRRLIRGLPDTLVVLDEPTWISPIKACCRSSKSTAICLSCAPAPRPRYGGAAAGFAVGRKELVDAVKAVKSPYNVNHLSRPWELWCWSIHLLGEALETILASKKQLVEGLEALLKEFPSRFTLLPSATNFASLRLPDGEALHHFLGETGHLGAVYRRAGAHHLWNAGGKPGCPGEMANYFAAAPAAEEGR